MSCSKHVDPFDAIICSYIYCFRGKLELVSVERRTWGKSFGAYLSNIQKTRKDVGSKNATTVGRFYHETLEFRDLHCTC